MDGGEDISFDDWVTYSSKDPQAFSTLGASTPIETFDRSSCLAQGVCAKQITVRWCWIDRVA